MEEVASICFKMFQLFFLLLILFQPILIESTSLIEGNSQHIQECEDGEYLDCDKECQWVEGNNIMV
jgi:hypothetical protein